MTTTQTGTFKVKSWKEQPTEASGGQKVTQVRATMTYQGVIDGEGTVEFLMYSPDGRVTYFVGMERVAGSIASRSGTAVFLHNGTYFDGVAKSKWMVVPGSGTEGLRGLRGEGRYGETDGGAEHGGQAPFSFSFDFE